MEERERESATISAVRGLDQARSCLPTGYIVQAIRPVWESLPCGCPIKQSSSIPSTGNGCWVLVRPGLDLVRPAWLVFRQQVSASAAASRCLVHARTLLLGSATTLLASRFSCL
jgi:hypothetical protein